MALTHSTGLRNFIITSGFATAFDTNGRINFYTGTKPAANDAATGTLLATLTLAADAFGSASNGGVAAGTITSDTSVDASGTPGYFIMYNSNETAPGSAAQTTDKRLLGTVTINGGGGDITFDSVTWIAGGTAAMSGFTWNAPA